MQKGGDSEKGNNQVLCFHSKTVLLFQVYKIANAIGKINCSFEFYHDRDVIVPTRNQSDPLNLGKKR